MQVTLPLAMPGIVAGLLLVFIPLAGDYVTASLLGGAKGNMAGALVASQFLAAQNWALGLGDGGGAHLRHPRHHCRRGRSSHLVVRAVIRKARAINLAPAAAVA